MKYLLSSASLSICAFISLGLKPIEDPARWTVKVSSQNGAQVVKLRLQADIDKGWHMYSSNNNSEYSPIPAHVSFKSPTVHKPLGKLISINAQKRYEPAFGVQTELFRKRATFVQQVRLLKPTKNIIGVVEYMACTDKDGTCVFRKAPFEVSLQ